jgi:hypothetical protein
MAVQDEDALKYIVRVLQPGSKYSSHGYPSYGYDLYVPNVMRSYAVEEGLSPMHSRAVELRVRELFPVFSSAAWELCHRGILRPGVSHMGAQSTDEGSAGAGYSITSFGRQWLGESHDDAFVPTEPERFGQLLDRFKQSGPGFHDRAQQAVRCYGAHAYLACCAMCGAAAESILSSVAIAKGGDNADVLRMYRSSNGRRQVENLVLGRLTSSLQGSFRAFTDVLKYWRDESAHGTAWKISDIEAHTSLALLLRFAQFASDRWQELTQP